MKSIVATSINIDDTGMAINDLLAQINIAPAELEGGVGFLFFDYEAKGKVISKKLHETLNIDIVSGGSVGELSQNGYLEMGMVLLILYGENIKYQILNIMEKDLAGNKFSACYKEACSKMSSAPTLLYGLFTEGVFDKFENLFGNISAVSGGLPLFGGLPCGVHGSLSLDREYLINGCNTNAVFTLVLIKTTTLPLFAVGNTMESGRGKTGEVTKSKKTVIYEIDNKPFVQYMEENGYIIATQNEQSYKLMFHKYPLMVWPPEAPDSQFLVRAPLDVNFEDGSISFLNHVPEQSLIHFTELTHSTIENTAKASLENLLAQIEEKEKEGHKYSTIFCITCEGRYTILNPFYELEGNVIKDLIPPHLNLIGYYSQGEFCPLQNSAANRKSNNLFHNCSIVFCAI